MPGVGVGVPLIVLAKVTGVSGKSIVLLPERACGRGTCGVSNLGCGSREALRGAGKVRPRTSVSGISVCGVAP